MEIREIENGVAIYNIKDFEPVHIFECGQSFRWYQQHDKSYIGVAKGKVIKVKKEGSDVIFNNTDIDEFRNIWFEYFDLNRDYENIKKLLSSDDVLKEAVKFGEGMRILKQDEWETLISFIISANNRIPMIKRAINSISEKWGHPIEYEGQTYYAFPDPEKLANASVKELEECSTGFRAKYIKEASLMISRGDINLYDLKNVGYDAARSELMKIPGVGPKVSDCVLLFSMGYYEAFPVDVWVKRVMQQFYMAPNAGLTSIWKYGRSKFGNLAGFAQQYLFYYVRELSKYKKTR